ncbi:MAG: hypothetical protein KBH14_09330, partial [Vicinamibacteria bacterium]|nr:hypothetical protein [Vicinamibacteria bacterium]
CDPGRPEGKLKCWFPEANLDSYREALIGTTPVVAFTFSTTFSNPEVAARDAAAKAAAAANKPAVPAKKK